MSTPEAHPYILQAPLYIAGEARVPGIDKPAKLSSNESPLGPSVGAVEAYQQAAIQLARYPDGGAAELRAALASHYNVDAEQIICGNGSEQLIDLLVRGYAGPGDEVLFSEYAFIAYRIAAQINGATPVSVPEKDFTVDTDAVLAAVSANTRIVFLANPNNPTGTYLNKQQVHDLRAKLPSRVLLVVDAAYSEYVDQADYTDAHELVDDNKANCVVLHTFSKIYGLAALRVGWALCPRTVAETLTRVRGVFNINTPAQLAAVAALQDQHHVEKSKAHNHHWLKEWQERLPELGLKVTPSIGNFILLHFDNPAQCQSADQHLRRNGIILRPVAPYGLPQCLRASIGLATENEKLLALLESFMHA